MYSDPNQDPNLFEQLLPYNGDILPDGSFVAPHILDAAQVSIDSGETGSVGDSNPERSLVEVVSEPQEVAEVPAAEPEVIDVMQPQSLLDKIKEARRLITRQRAVGGGILIAAGVAFGFEQSPLNEVFRADRGFDVLQATHNEFAVGAAVFGLTFAIEMVASGLIALGLNHDFSTLRRFQERMRKKQEEQMALRQEKLELKAAKRQQRELEGKNGIVRRSIEKVGSVAGTPLRYAGEKLGDLGLAFGVGAGIVMMKYHFKDKDPSLRKDLVTSVKASALVGSMSGSIGFLLAGGITKAEKVGLERPAQFIIDHGSDNKFWLAIAGIAYAAQLGPKGIKALARKIRGRNSDAQDDQPAVEAE